MFHGRILFGPLTGIEVLSTRIDGSVVVIECDFSINLTALTLEQVLGKRRNLIDQMSEQIVDQLKRLLKGTGYAKQGVSLMEAEVAAARKDDPEWYNEDVNFLAAVQAVLDAKALVLGPAKLEWIAGLEVEEAEQHAQFVLESAKSGDERKVRAALAVLNSFEGSQHGRWWTKLLSRRCTAQRTAVARWDGRRGWQVYLAILATLTTGHTRHTRAVMACSLLTRAGALASRCASGWV